MCCRFRALGRLESKYDDTMLEYYLAFMAMCKRVAGLDLSEEEGRQSRFNYVYIVFIMMKGAAVQFWSLITRKVI